MAKRKRLTPARMVAPAPSEGETPRPTLSARPPIADVAQDAATSAAFTEVAAELASARAEGRLVQRLPLAAIDAAYLVRDRIALDPGEMTALKDSLRARGQQTPIEVSALPDGRYGLISGYRRLCALRELESETPEIDSVLALVRPAGEARDAYCAMVEENEIRANLSFYERARIVARAADAGVYDGDQAALSALFAHVPRARRSKIKSFVGIVRALDGHLHHPALISEKLGLALAKALAADADLVRRLIPQLATARTPKAEAQVLTQAATGHRPAPPEITPLPIGVGLGVLQRPNGDIVLSGDKTRDADFVRGLMQALDRLV